MKFTKSQRQAYGETLVQLGKEREDIVVLEADLGKSTMSCLFEQAFPNRYFEMGIGEQNMLSTAAGLAAGGKIAFCSTFSVFLCGRAYDQIRQTISIGRLNVKMCGSSSGFSDAGDGATHQAIEDLALMSAIPGMTIFTPCDAWQTRAAVLQAAKTEGPVFIRVVRNDLPDLTSTLPQEALSLPQVMREGTDVMVVTHGCMVQEALKAGQMLAKDGVSAKIVHLPVFKPFPYTEVATLAQGVKAVITAEDHNFIGGLASHTALALRKSCVPMDYVAVQDEFGQSAHSVEQLLCHYQLTANEIAMKAKFLLQ